MHRIRAWAAYLAPGFVYFALATGFVAAILLRDRLGLPGLDTYTDVAQGFFDSYGLYALYVAAILESLFMVCLYFPGSFVFILAILVSDRSFLALSTIIVIGWASVLTATVINYWLGREGFYRILLHWGAAKTVEDMQAWLDKRGRWAIFISAAHPNVLAVTNICMGIAHTGLSRAIAYSFVAIGFWIPLQVYVLGFVLPDPKASAELLQLMIAGGFVWMGVREVRRKNTISV